MENSSKNLLQPIAIRNSSYNSNNLILMNQFNQPKPIQGYSSIQQLIKLPPLNKLPFQKNLFQKPQRQLIESTFISNQLKRNLIDQRELLMNQFYIYENPVNFQFYLPQSKFPLPSNGQYNHVSYQRQHYIEPQNTYRDRLSSQQIQQIKQSGQFKVKSSREWLKIPYIWKLNTTLFKGIKNIQLNWNQRLSIIHSVFTSTWEMLIEDLPKQLVSIGKFPWRIYCLLFGKKQMRVSYSVIYDREIAKDFWNQVMSKHYVISKEWGSEIWKIFESQFRFEIYQDVSFKGNLEEYKRKKADKLKQKEDYEKRKKNSNERVNQMNIIANRFSENWQKINKKFLYKFPRQFQKSTEITLTKLKIKIYKFRNKNKRKFCKDLMTKSSLII